MSNIDENTWCAHVWKWVTIQPTIVDALGNVLVITNSVRLDHHHCCSASIEGDKCRGIAAFERCYCWLICLPGERSSIPNNTKWCSKSMNRFHTERTLSATLLARFWHKCSPLGHKATCLKPSGSYQMLNTAHIFDHNCNCTTNIIKHKSTSDTDKKIDLTLPYLILSSASRSRLYLDVRQCHFSSTRNAPMVSALIGNYIWGNHKVFIEHTVQFEKEKKIGLRMPIDLYDWHIVNLCQSHDRKAK